VPKVAFRAVRGRERYFTEDLADRVKSLVGQRMEREVKPHFLKQFEAIVADWDHKVQFKARKYIGPDGLRFTVHPTGKNAQIWDWVTRGTKGPYDIPKSPGPTLAFQLGYIPHTAPGGGYGGAGRATGEMVYAKHVTHPGIKAREFEKHIARRNKRWFSRKMEAIWKWAIRRL